MKHIDIISESFNLDKKKIKPNDRVNELMDSMVIISLISNVDAKFSKILDDKKFENIVYFKDIDNLIEKTIK
jgi:acyl carrier protein|tara:strand:- start:1454 stop:1669 length:216 start_codon:yes stop_codon:yes gene_type:complete